MSVRDPKRRKRILKLIEKIWDNAPDLRLFQLLINIVVEAQDECFYYYIEDTYLETLLKNFIVRYIDKKED